MFYFDTDDHILDAIGECFAADGGYGSVDSFQKHRLKEKLEELAAEERSDSALTGPRFDALLFRYVRENILDHGAYGFEDLTSFIGWMRDEMGFG